MPLVAGVLEPRKGYQFRPENVTLPLILHQWLGDAAHSPPATAVDLGCGSGSLLLGALYGLPSLRAAVGVEQQADAVDRCRRTVAAHGLPATICEGDLRALALQAQARAALGADADLVVMNPPFFPSGWGAPSRQESTRLSTHAERGDVRDFLRAAYTLCAPQGLIVSLFDAQRLHDLIAAATDLGLGLWRLAWVPDQRPGLGAQPLRAWVGLRSGQGCALWRVPTDADAAPWDARP
jgi:tRNA1(Val) A37 N6-methylase TrmN6